MQTYNLKKTTYGSTVPQISFSVTGKNLTNALIEMRIMRNGRVIDVKKSPVDITITPPTTFVIKAFNASYRPGSYRYAIRITLNGTAKTYISGTWVIESEI